MVKRGQNSTIKGPEAGVAVKWVRGRQRSQLLGWGGDGFILRWGVWGGNVLEQGNRDWICDLSRFSLLCSVWSR